jgi:hypothetical protein
MLPDCFDLLVTLSLNPESMMLFVLALLLRLLSIGGLLGPLLIRRFLKLIFLSHLDSTPLNPDSDK